MTTRAYKDLLRLAWAQPLDIDALAAALDAASPADRLAVVRELTPTVQERLFNAAEGRLVTLDDIVPPGTGSLTEVIHEGKNTLPAFTLFQKRFCLPSTAAAPADRKVLWGYNHQTLGAATGPGYFVAYDDEIAGEVVIDYRELPPEHPAEWPKIISNKARLGLLVYHGMVDRLRRVSEHVTIGRAYKKKPMPAWFALVRQD